MLAAMTTGLLVPRRSGGVDVRTRKRRRGRRRKTTTRGTSCWRPTRRSSGSITKSRPPPPGARFFFNTIRPGSVATDERVIDLATGQPLKWEVVSGKEHALAGHPTADPETEYIKVHLARPVPQGGEARAADRQDLQGCEELFP